MQRRLRAALGRVLAQHLDVGLVGEEHREQFRDLLGGQAAQRETLVVAARHLDQHVTRRQAVAVDGVDVATRLHDVQ